MWRLIGENVAFLRDVVDFCSSSGAPAALSLYQEKAFDRFDWTFLRSTLYATGFILMTLRWLFLPFLAFWLSSMFILCMRGGRGLHYIIVNVRVCGWVVRTVALTHRSTLLGRL